jgi:curved DNA-binding protein CbpA
MKNHYDALNVPEDASEDEIRAAYKAAAKEHHPDLNSGSAESRRIMQSINEAYAVLSDPVRRWDYDRVLKFNRELEDEPDRDDESIDDEYDENDPDYRRESVDRAVAGIFAAFRGFFGDVRVALLVAVLAVWGILSLAHRDRPARSRSGAIPGSMESFQFGAATSQPRYFRSALSPIGTNWPSTADYVEGYPIEGVGGLSSVTIDNTGNTSDVFLKLVQHTGSETVPIRTCYIPARSLFTFSTVRAGRYHVRYRDLNTGVLSKSEEFDLIEKSANGKTEFSKFNIPLYQVPLGGEMTDLFADPDF